MSSQTEFWAGAAAASECASLLAWTAQRCLSSPTVESWAGGPWKLPPWPRLQLHAQPTNRLRPESQHRRPREWPARPTSPQSGMCTRRCNLFYRCPACRCNPRCGEPHPKRLPTVPNKKHTRNAGFNQSLKKKRALHVQSSLRYRKAAPAPQAMPNSLPALKCESSRTYTNLLMCQCISLLLLCKC